MSLAPPLAPLTRPDSSTRPGSSGRPGPLVDGTRTARAAVSASAGRRGRDAAVDLVRAACLVLVVLLHACMVGVSIGADGPVLENALEGWAGFPALTWLAQIMPLFFLLGGFSGFLQWGGYREAGRGYGEYLAGRMRRLLLPAGAALTAVVLLLAALALTGVPAELVATAGFRMSQPLWFLGVYILCTAALPPLAELHRRAPAAAPLALGVAVVVVDALRAGTGVTAIGFANLLFVWLLVQQLGFLLANDAPAPRVLAVTAGGALATLALLCALGVYSFDLYANLNPPSGALVLLAVAHLALFRLARPRLRALAARPVLARACALVGERAMTVYAWHMPALIVLTGGLLLSGLPLPEPLSADWWLTRPLWLLAALGVVAVTAAAAGRFEGRSAARGRVGTGRALAGAAAGAGGILIVLLAGSTLAGWIVGVALVRAGHRIPDRSPSTATLTR